MLPSSEEGDCRVLGKSFWSILTESPGRSSEALFPTVAPALNEDLFCFYLFICRGKD